MARGTITKIETEDGTRWRVRVDMIDPKTGRRLRPQRTYKTRREAETGLTQWSAEIERGMAVVPSGKTLGEYLEFWLDTSARHRVRASTLDSYAQKVRLYIRPILGHIPLQRLTPAQVQTLYSDLLRGKPTRAAISPRTVRYVHAILHRALKEAVGLGLAPRNVTDTVAPPKATRPPIKTWDEADIQRFLTVAQPDGYSPLWLIALHTGMRQGELLGLRWQDLDLPQGVLRVQQSASTVKNGERFTPPKTASGRRTIALDAPSIAALKEHRIRQNERRLALGTSWQDHDLVFASEIGTPLDHNNVYHRFVALVKKAGVPRIPFHGLRHTHATLLMKHGVHPKVASERLDHANITLTLQTYSHVLPQMQQEAASIFAAAVAGES